MGSDDIQLIKASLKSSVLGGWVRLGVPRDGVRAFAHAQLWSI